MNANELKRLVIQRLQACGFELSHTGVLSLQATEKEAIRLLHQPATNVERAAHQAWLHRHLDRYLPYFADGEEVDPMHIQPELVEVRTKDHANLFRIARLLWSIPLSKGYGRRLRFLVFDHTNQKLIGILALQSPPLSFPSRDRLFRYPPDKKTELVNQTMDIQTLGAVPPYDRLLGGKLIAYAAAANEIRAAYRRKYEQRATEMEQRILPPHLVALTTTSAFGRSSIYNRLRYHHLSIAESIGFTEGYGSFHLIELYPLFRTFLEQQGISTRGGFGVGPRRTWQTIVRALERLGLSASLLQHGVKREVFLFRLIDNLEDYLEGRTSEPQYRDLPFATLAAWWRSRWLLPRAERVQWQSWCKEDLRHRILLAPSEVVYERGT
ncbi:Druantia anti-phage system protein DruA [Chloroflexus sp.]|uniref:Druantia anti-phage system protein DruA n=1 Tax=Chloroflexus sp. TaxID=1904827 RepID=UPI003C7726A4